MNRLTGEEHITQCKFIIEMCVCSPMSIILKHFYDVESKLQILIFEKYYLHCKNKYKNKKVNSKLIFASLILNLI